MNREKMGGLRRGWHLRARNGLAFVTLRCGFGRAPISLLCYIHYKHLHTHAHKQTLK